MPLYTLSKLAKDAGLTSSRVRNYVERGLIKPTEKTENGTYVFSPKDVNRLKRIKFLRDNGKSILEILAILAGENQ